MTQLNLFDEFNEPKKKTKYELKKEAIPFSYEIRRIADNYIGRFCGTGHRPDKLGSYHKLEQSERVIVPQLVNYLQAFHSLFADSPEDKILVISGMAQGWDTWLALAALESGICHLMVSIPCIGQESPWPPKAQERHRFIVSQADQVVIVCENYDYDSMSLRNEYMVDESELVLAMWNGTRGGTGNCIDYCNEVGRPYINFWEQLAPIMKL
jgi:uncharacterized phage-like protein YoqJ